MRGTRMTLAVVAVLTLTGCGFRGVNDVPLPLTKGGGDDAVEATVYLENAVNLVPNSEVKLDDLTVGSVRRIEWDDWRAKLTIGVEKDAKVPSDVTAKIAQKSLLGAEYLELASPEDGGSGLLADGDVLGLERTGRYPETEEVLAGAAMLLNGGGLGQVQTINREINLALEGREPDVRSFIDELRTFTSSLDAQRDNIVATLEQLDRFAAGLDAEGDVVDEALAEIPRGIDALADEREELVGALAAVGRISDVAHRIRNQSGEDLRVNLKNLEKVTGALAAAGENLGKGLGAISFPFPIAAIDPVFRGDYLNFYATFNIDIKDIERYFLAGTPLDTLFSGLGGAIPFGTVDDLVNPLLEPLPDSSRGILKPLDDLLGGLAPGPSGSGSSGGGAKPSPEATKAPNLLEQLLGGGR